MLGRRPSTKVLARKIDNMLVKRENFNNGKPFHYISEPSDNDLMLIESLLDCLSEKKIEQLKNAMYLNYYYTSEPRLPKGTLTAYTDNYYYMEFEGTRCRWTACWTLQKGRIKLVDRKPKNLEVRWEVNLNHSMYYIQETWASKINYELC